MKNKSLVPVLCIVGLLLVWAAVFADEFECRDCKLEGERCTGDWSCLGYNHATCNDCYITCYNGTQVEHQCNPPGF